MSDNNDSRPTPLGIYDRPTQGRITGIEITSVVLSVVWLGGAGLYFLGGGEAEGDAGAPGVDGGFLLKMLVLFLPVAMIWVAATAARASRVMREESRRLQAAIDAIRHAYVAQNQSKGAQSDKTVAAKLEEIAEAQKKTETALAVFTTTRDRNAPLRDAGQPTGDAQAQDEQAALPLGTPADEIGPPLSREDFVRALNFPETTEDEAGFAALRKALQDREAAHLIRASQDILTLLSQDGIYMDDLRPDMARAEIWRRFAAGERGRAVAGLGGIRDRSSLALTAGRMKQDPIFRDAAHHFLRRFDKMLAEFEKTASDSDISDLAGTRTARAFMLLGRVAGIFD
ncbi:MAG: hypothetical protein RI566_05055 [Sediminimonas sp.]|uniref:hypothetical protein n=1 Tax=Sediminimonas sp. TaxID=2823379 RepID=UPI0028703C6E|nr:hypothetical protein [Sediminimonas sp.]MDR9484521.1 hypothetical protein [Sediminimonas sp.]